MYRDVETIGTSEARRRFSELISRAAAGERFLVRRRNQPVAALLGLRDLERLERLSENVYRLAAALGQDVDLLRQVRAGEIHPAMAAYGLWKDTAPLTDEGEGQ